MLLKRRAIFDCNAMLQAASRPDGPAGECMRLASAGRWVPVVSPSILAEFEAVVSRAKVRTKMRLSEKAVAEFLRSFRTMILILPDPPELVTFDRDPGDANYINLSIASKALLIVTRDTDLLDLMWDTDAAGVKIRADYPGFRVLTPPAFLDELRAGQP